MKTVYVNVIVKTYILPQKCKARAPWKDYRRATTCSPGEQVLSQPGKGCLDHEWVKMAAPVLGALHKQHVSGILSLLHLPVSQSWLSISCHSPAHQQRVHITRLSAKQLMRLGSKLSIIFVSLLCLGNILAQRNKETWATMAQSQAIFLSMDVRS